jgi:hypothetical protein
MANMIQISRCLFFISLAAVSGFPPVHHVFKTYNCPSWSFKSSLFDADNSYRPVLSVIDRGELYEKWGLTQESSYREFPNTMEALVAHAFDAIAGTIYNKHSYDPNIANNARSKSIFTNRPVRKNVDAGRIGLEMDGIHFLDQPNLTPGQAMRRIALMLAGKLSSDESWKKFETRRNEEKQKTEEGGYRPVVVYFNTIKQALWASEELLLLKKMNSATTAYNNVRILCLSDGVPRDMQMDKSHRKRYGGLRTGFVNATRGLFMIVQPSDYNGENTPPGPALEAINHFQRIVAQGAVQELPIIALSPRFLSNESPFYGRDQSIYQQSAIYGGTEPPKGPTPWVMRDFTPPVFCWIANAVPLRKRPKEDCEITRIALGQSIMDEGHLWNIFAAKECSHRLQRTSTTNYHYLASTRSASGRPTKDLMKNVLENYYAEDD